MYVVNNTSSSPIIRITISTGQSDPTWCNANLYYPTGITIDKINRNLYVAVGGNNTIVKVSLDDPNSPTTWLSGFSNIFGITIDEQSQYLYVTEPNIDTIYKIEINNPTPTPVFFSNDTPFPCGLCLYDDYLYVASFYDSMIYKISINPPLTFTVWATPTQGLNTPIALVTDKTYMYASNTNGLTTPNNIVRIKLTDVSDYNPNFITNLNLPYSMTTNNNDLYVGNFGNSTISLYTNILTPFTPTPIICFKEDTKILTNKGYLPIQGLRKGDLVKTLKNDYVPIDMIGKKDIYHPASEERIKDQLYKCSKEQFPEVFEDLVLTGCHCILVDDFKSEEEREKTKKVNGRIFITDNKYRLPACVDEKTKVYENKGNHTIYHFALENEDYYMNYGVFANGLLVESTSKRFMKELSGMDLI